MSTAIKRKGLRTLTMAAVLLMVINSLGCGGNLILKEIFKQADTTALETAIISAIAEKAGVIVDTDGIDVATTVFWVTQDDSIAFEAAIVAAQVVVVTAGTDQAKVDAAKTTLDTAIVAFTAKKSAGISGNTYAISGTISVDTGTPDLTDVVVQLKKADGTDEGVPVNPQGDGTYTITNVLAGRGYTIEVSLTGYNTQTTDSFSVLGNVTNMNVVLPETPL